MALNCAGQVLGLCVLIYSLILAPSGAKGVPECIELE